MQANIVRDHLEDIGAKTTPSVVQNPDINNFIQSQQRTGHFSSMTRSGLEHNGPLTL